MNPHIVTDAEEDSSQESEMKGIPPIASDWTANEPGIN